jgi:DNA-binding transcriptional ArsR family regulator
MSKVTLDAETFRALASTTRLSVLRALDERRKTLSELARGLELNKATLHEHLQLLSSADLVRKRDDEGRKWIYYELTWRGQRLLHPQETTTFNVLLGLGIAAAGGGVAMLGRALGWWLDEHATLGASEASLGDQTDTGAATNAGFANDSPASGASASSSAPASSPPSSPPPASPSPSPASPSPAPTPPASPPTPAPAPSASSSPAYSMHHEDSALTNAGSQKSVAVEHHSFWDDNGWIAIALLACTVLFGFLAYKLHRKFRPGKFVPPTGADADVEQATGRTG